MKDENQVFSIWKDGHNLLVVSGTNKEAIEKLKQWAKRQGYEVRKQER